MDILPAAEWRDRETRHLDAVNDLLAGHLHRAGRGEHHPVEDFLFTYYRHRPADLRRWHGGGETVLLDAQERRNWRYYRPVIIGRREGVAFDVERFVAERTDSVRYVADLLSATAGAPAHFGCFGLHEWAMVFSDADRRRHGSWPLRLGAQGTDEVVRSHQIRCSHYDAFRFFAPAARRLNLWQPTLAGRVGQEQPGCLHASMDLYKWAYKVSPLVASELVLDCFRLSRSIREVDMRASPYDLTALGLQPIAIETGAGKAEYVRAQREFAEAGQRLRKRLLEALGPALRALPS